MSDNLNNLNDWREGWLDKERALEQEMSASDDCLVQVSKIIVGKITDANIHFDRNLVEVALRQYLVNVLRSRKYKSDKRNSLDPVITEEWKQKRKAQNIKYNKKRAKESIVSKMDSEEQETVKALSVEPVATKDEKAISGAGRLQAIKERAECKKQSKNN